LTFHTILIQIINTMIKSTYKILLLAVSILLIMSSCKEEDNILEYTGDSFYRFAAESGSVLENATEAAELEVFYSVPGGGSGSIDFTIQSDLVQGTDYTLLNSSNSLSFSEANDYKDVIRIMPIDNEDVGTSPATINITLTNPSGGLVGFPGPDALSSTHQLNIVEDDCPSTLAGTYDFSTQSYFCAGDAVTGQVTWTEVGTGLYEVDDWGYGSYQVCYGNIAGSWGTLQFTDVCNEITIIGVDNYGDSWMFTEVSTSGANLTFTWSNTYDETGVTTLTRTDGTDWPSLYIP